MSLNPVNYQYHAPLNGGHDVPKMRIDQQQHITYMPSGYAQDIVYETKIKYHERPRDSSAMAILNSEQYNDGAGPLRSTTGQQTPMIPLFGLVEQPQEMEAAHQPNLARQSHDMEGGTKERRRKKQKRTSDDEVEDEATKRARGRPRVDTKDETAADRRRTQIRMAQRAYRHRKETTISSLEKQVQDLKATNEQMSNIFLILHDYAIGSGLLQREPDFGNHLKSTTERFLALARSMSSDENSKDEDATSQDGSKRSHSEVDLEFADHPIESEHSATQAHQSEILPTVTTSIWGYEVTKEDDKSNQMKQLNWNQQPYMGTSRQDHQIISRATFDNASFGFDTFDNDNLQLYRAEIPEMNEYQIIAAFQETLPLTNTLAHHEDSFGRYLARAAIECGFRLISNPHANPVMLNSVFGFCLRFETREDITTRLKRTLEKTSKEPLFTWRAPFVHLGGAGTYYPQDESMGGPLMPKFRTGMSMGPFSPKVMETKATAMFDDFRMNIPGFEGEFFDSNDVEGYLRGRGIDIPPNAEFITVDLDEVNMPDIASPRSVSDSNTVKPFSPETPRSPEARVAELISHEENLTPQIDEFFMNISNNDVDMNFSIPFSAWDSQEQGKISSNLFEPNGTIFDSASGLIQQNTVNLQTYDKPYQEKHFVTLSVRTLIGELSRKATCLGRAPGFRPADVETALRRALKRAL